MGDTIKTFHINIQSAEGSQHVCLNLDSAKFTQRLITNCFLQNQLYEKELTFFLLKVLGPGDVFLDIGAHVGYFSLIAAKTVGDRGLVVRVEPNEDNVSCLAKHVALNHLTNVQIVKAIAADAIGNLDNDGGHALWNPGKNPFNRLSAMTSHRKGVKKVSRTVSGFRFERCIFSFARAAS